jgi:hypothetical protein
VATPSRRSIPSHVWMQMPLGDKLVWIYVHSDRNADISLSTERPGLDEAPERGQVSHRRNVFEK